MMFNAGCLKTLAANGIRRFFASKPADKRCSELCLVGQFDVAVIGGGLVGTATAKEILQTCPQIRCVLIEKEDCVAGHQSGYNAGIIQSPITACPGTVRAKLNCQGIGLAYEYAGCKRIKHCRIGELVVAKDEKEADLVNGLYRMASMNGVQGLELLDCKGIKNIEPNCKGVCGLYSPQTGLVDWASVNENLRNDFQMLGGKVQMNYNVKCFDISPDNRHDSPNLNMFPANIYSDDNRIISAAYVLCCTGLFADRISRLSGGQFDPYVLPVRGQFFELNPDKWHLVNSIIHPVPNLKEPFPRPKIMKRLDGSVWVGPVYAVALKREGYNTTDWSLSDIQESVGYIGARNFIKKHAKYLANQWSKCTNPQKLIEDLIQYFPLFCSNDLRKIHAGVLALPIDCKGNVVEDVIMDNGTGAARQRILHCRTVPDPGATNSLSMAKVLADMVLCEIKKPMDPNA